MLLQSVLFVVGLSTFTGAQLTNYVNIPAPMSYSDFQSHVLNQLKAKRVFIQSDNEEFDPLLAFRMNVTQLDVDSFSFQQSGERETSPGSRICIDFALTYDSISSTTAEFVFSTGSYWILFSDKPNKYFWSIQCRDWMPGDTTCPKDKAFISFFNDPDDKLKDFTKTDGYTDMGLVGNLDSLITFTNTDDSDACTY